MARDPNTCGPIVRDSDSPHPSWLDDYWDSTPPQCACIECGEVDDLPRGVEYDEFVCADCKAKEDDE